MQKFFHEKVLTPFLAVVLAAACIAGGAFLGGSGGPGAGTAGKEVGNAAGKEVEDAAGNVTESAAESIAKDAAGSGEPLSAGDELILEQIYEAAVADAVTAEEDELFPLVTLTGDGGKVSIQDGKVLLLTVNDSPDLYQAGITLTLPGEVWTFTDREIAEWYPDHKAGVTDWALRLEQLVGVPPDADYTHVTAMWVSPEDVIRPAYVTDVTDSGMTIALPEDTSEEYREWFNGNIIWSYFDSAYPWTRMGYTYDWAPDSGKYGLTEFLVRPGAEAKIEYTDSIDAFIERLEAEQG